MDIKEVQGVMQDTKIIAEEHHKAIHDALTDINSEETPKIDVKPVEIKKDETKKVTAKNVEAPKAAVPSAPISAVQKKGEDLVPVPGLP
jgi:hypothetical protein